MGQRRQGHAVFQLNANKLQGCSTKVKVHDLRLNFPPLFCQRQHSCLDRHAA